MDTIVLFPAPEMGHLISTVELGKLIVKYYPSFTITILIVTPPKNTVADAANTYISQVSATIPSITFHRLPTVSLSRDPTSYTSFVALSYELLCLHNPNVREVLCSLSLSSTIRAFILDFFSSSAQSVAAELSIPVYYFFTSNASCLALAFHFSTIHQKTTKSFKDLETVFDIPGLPPLPSKDMPDPVLIRTSEEYESFLNFSLNVPKSSGVIVNTFNLINPGALEAISEGLCIADGPTPPVFFVGPLMDTNLQTIAESDCLKWLDNQPKKSVVFLSFGSMGLFSMEQLREIAVGLENSRVRFLWVVRSPPTESKSKLYAAQIEADLDTLLPPGFLERTKERGLVVKSWAPQVAVLNHGSVGGFVTHCGWNSVLESVCAGVPMLAWPLYGEQRLNKLLLVKEWRLALPIETAKDGLVSAPEVEKRVRDLMNSEEGDSVRKRVVEMRECAKAAMSEGGSSRLALATLVDSWISA